MGGESTSRLVGLVYLLADRGVVTGDAVGLVLRVGDTRGRGELRGLCFELLLLLDGVQVSALEERRALEEVLVLLDRLAWGGRGVTGRRWRRLGAGVLGLPLAVLVLVFRPIGDAGWSGLAFWFGPVCLVCLGVYYGWLPGRLWRLLVVARGRWFTPGSAG